MTEIRLPDLKVEVDGDAADLEQDLGAGDVHRVTLHRSQVRVIAETMGLIGADADGKCHSDVMANAWHGQSARMARQMHILRDRINTLDNMLIEIGGMGHEDVDAQCAYSAAALDLVDEFIADLPPAGALHPDCLAAALATQRAEDSETTLAGLQQKLRTTADFMERIRLEAQAQGGDVGFFHNALEMLIGLLEEYADAGADRARAPASRPDGVGVAPRVGGRSGGDLAAMTGAERQRRYRARKASIDRRSSATTTGEVAEVRRSILQPLQDAALFAVTSRDASVTARDGDAGAGVTGGA